VAKMRALACILLLLSFAPAHAIFLVGDAQDGGEVPILCEGQPRAYLSTPSGETRALALDAASQASFFPQSSGPYTVQCGRETKTISVQMPSQPGAAAYGGDAAFITVACVAAAFLLAAFIAAKILLRQKTEFTKREEGGRVKLCLRAGEALSHIEITDPDGGGAGSPLRLSVPRLAAGASWEWEYEQGMPGSPLAPARMSANSKRGRVVLASGASFSPKAKAGMQKMRALPKNQ